MQTNSGELQRGMPFAAAAPYRGHRLLQSGAQAGVAGGQGRMMVPDEENLLDTATDFAFAGEPRHCIPPKPFSWIGFCGLDPTMCKEGWRCTVMQRSFGPQQLARHVGSLYICCSFL